MLEIEYYFLIFFIYSFLGWCIEVIQGIISNHKFVNRGFLVGPCCPIYGYGVILITLCLSNLMAHPVALFVLVIVICSILEYTTSYIMQKLFNARWWDYSNMKFNINGRICLETMLAFGVLGTIIIYFLNPFFKNIILNMNETVALVTCIVLTVIYIIDNIISFKVVANIKVATNMIKDNTEEITEKVKEILIKKSVLTRRLIESFPNMKIKIKRNMKKINVKIEKTKRAIKNKSK